MTKQTPPRVLVVDDEPSVGMIFHRILGEVGYEVISASNGAECLRVLRKEDVQLVFLDLQMPGMDGVQTFKKIRETHSKLPVIIMTAFQTVNSAVETMKLGALDYLIKPLEADKLNAVVRQALDVSKMSSTVVPSVSVAGEESDVDMMAKSPEMQKVMALVKKVAPTEVPVLILGESGTGKEVTARTVHRLSKRAKKPFVVVDCAALPESIIESELFGYEKGAFTGADNSRAGKFEQANSGTLFLDEIGNLSLPIQAKLLRFLQEPRIERLGARKGPIKLDVRILAATNADLEKVVAAGTFREDLYHRLKVFVVELPALRQRGPEDLDALIVGLVDGFRRQLGKPRLSVASETLGLLKAYRWPGNVRELQNALRSATLLADDVVLPEHLPMSIRSARPAMETQTFFAGLDDVIRKVEREHIETVLKKNSHDLTKTAHELGLDVATLEEKIKNLAL
ncbi:MAG: sigma-54-dependent Fis family transcriptional regulator [Elusimicrobia bacterium]|nr:sigma-54-dependent Fis family transcriptional regulator [Elusimicrobiota bacterium]